MAAMRRNLIFRRFDGLERPTLWEEEKNAVATHISAPHQVVLVNAGQTQYLTIEGGGAVEVGNVQGGLKNSGQLGHAGLISVEPTLF